MLLNEFNTPRMEIPEVLYHKDKGFPDDIEMPRGFTPVMDVTYSSHAKEEATKDIYGKIGLPHRIDVRKAQTVEIGVRGNVVSKLVLRFSYDDTRDIVMVLLPDRGFVKTVWLNEKSDQHKMTNLSRYADPKAPRPMKPEAVQPRQPQERRLSQQEWRDKQAQQRPIRH